MAKSAKKSEERNIFNGKYEPLIYLVPFILGLALFTIYPVINVVFMSFKQGYKLSGVFNGWGFSNYTKVLTDKLFLSAIKNTFIYAFSVVPIATLISLVIANLLNQKIKGIAFFHTAYFLPLVTSTIAVGLVWKYMFNQQYGLLNYIITAFGGKAINWLGADNGQAPYNIIVIIIFGIYDMIPMTTILLLSGLQNIDPLYYTAAKVDGASTAKLFTRITVPLLSPTIFLTLVINTISSFKVYNAVIPFWRGQAGVTGTNLYTMVYYIKETFYANHKLGNAAAASIVLFVIIFAFTMLQLWIQKKSDN